MAEHTFYDFDWDPAKARTNLKKHGVSFRLATTVFHDPLALTIGHLEKPVIPAKAGIQFVEFTGSPPSRGRRIKGFSRYPIFDDEHSEHEERWVSVGQAENGQCLVVVHTSAWQDCREIKVQVISARKADRQEVRDYENAPR